MMSRNWSAFNRNGGSNKGSIGKPMEKPNALLKHYEQKVNDGLIKLADVPKSLRDKINLK